MKAAGSCLCGDVTYVAAGPLRNVINCHCHRCRRHTGHFMAATATDADKLEITGESLRWYDATDTVQYGFCGTCGSTLFWKAAGNDTVSIAAGTLHPPTGLKTTSEIFTSEASDYHRFDTTIPHYPRDRDTELG